MSTEFARILSGLMSNRRLSPTALSYASGRAESTINRILAGSSAPSTAVLQDLAPALELSVADLLVIAGLPAEPVSKREGPYEASNEIGSLVAAASWLAPDQVEQVTALARRLRADNH